MSAWVKDKENRDPPIKHSPINSIVRSLSLSDKFPAMGPEIANKPAIGTIIKPDALAP